MDGDLRAPLLSSRRSRLEEGKAADYQKIILTHDLGFFQEIRRRIGNDQHKWHFAKIAGDSTEGRRFNTVKSDLDQAKDYLANDQLAECGNQLRKRVETNLTTFLEQAAHPQIIHQ